MCYASNIPQSNGKIAYTMQLACSGATNANDKHLSLSANAAFTGFKRKTLSAQICLVH